MSNPRPTRPAKSRRYKSITVDVDALEDFELAADAMEAQLGFRPTHSQVVRHLVKCFNNSTA